jgi:sugar (pentulose or hexulose) kinase
MPHAKGAAIGFSDNHTRIHLYRSIIEGLNFELMRGLESLQKRGKFTTKKIFVAGGGAKSDEVCQITASQFGLPVYRTQTHEAGGIGAALCAFVAKGVFASYEEGLSAMVHIKDEFLPNEADHAIYRQLYERVFIKLFDKLSPIYEAINDIIKK